MTCESCGATLEDGARFCGVCGHRLDAAVPSDPKRRERSPPAASKKRTAPSNKKGRAMAGGPAAPAAEPDRYIGTTLNGRFTVEDKLGEGGFGAVYKGVQLVTGRKVAIKLLHPEMTRDQNVVARFRREGQVLCSLRDAHTITTYDFDQTADGTLFIAMELLEGRSLQDVFRDEAPLAWPRLLKIMSEMCSSLEEAHSLGIVHRDLKPENVYLESRPGNPEFVKILDFGIAKVIRGDGSSGIAGEMSPQLTATGQTLGTLEYMSPEQLMGKELDGRSDIYAIGVVTFEMLTGRLPFPDAIGPAALISAQLKKTPPSASKVHAKGGIPPLVDQLILKMLAKDRNQRFRDVSELRKEIDSILATGGLGRSATAAEPSPTLASAPSSAAPLASSPVSAPSPALPHPPPSRTPPSGATPERRSWSGHVAPSDAGPGGPTSGTALGGASADGFAHAAPTSSPTDMTAGGAGPRPPPQWGAGGHAPSAWSGGRQEAPAAPGMFPDSSAGHQVDPPWAGRTDGSPGSLGPTLHAGAGPVGAAARARARPRGGGAGHTRWMWITVLSILALAAVVGGVLALR